MSDLWDNFTERFENDYVQVWVIVEKLHEWKKQNKPAYRQFYQLIGMFFSTCNLADKVTLFYVNESGNMMPFKQENNVDGCSTHNLIMSLLKIDPYEDIDECSLDVFEIYETYIGCFWKLDELEQIEQFKNIKVFAQLFADGNASTSLKNETHSLHNKQVVYQPKPILQSLGGKIRAEKYEQLKIRIFQEWSTGEFHSYAQYAKEHADTYGLSTKTIEKWLSQTFSKNKK